MKLHIGCGDCYKENWINIDINSTIKVDLLHDASKPFPYIDNSIDFIYNEHFIEHLSLEDGIKFINEMYRILKKGGVMRIACPDLDLIIDQYINNSWKEDFNKAGLSVSNKCEMLNISMRSWEHKYIYNYEDLELRLKNCGFIDISRKELSQSAIPELRGIETRWQSFLIIEATK